MSTKKRTVGSKVNNLDPELHDIILNLGIRKDLLDKFHEDEKQISVSSLVDLRDLTTKSETEVYDTLNRIFFMYCGPLLLNINPGPNYVNDYLNLQKWMKETENVPDVRWKPHLYSFVNYVYKTLITEKKDQSINMLGQIGSGKTFNLVHILEYLCYIGGIENFQKETFETIHKSIQLIHILGSILRQNNLESTSCGMLLRLGFNEEHKICNFDIESKILDFTLPFSQNGRSFSILHALMTGGNIDIKRSLELPELDFQLNFFKKFSKNFDEKTKEKFKLNDLEIWTRFHSLLNFFKFSKAEVLELMQLFSFILLCNEAAIGSTKGKKGNEEFCINKGHSSKKLAKVFGMSEEEFMKKFSTFKDINEIKNTLISLMKNTYYMIFEFVKNKVKLFLKSYFEKITGMNLPSSSKINSSMDHSFSNTNKYNIKYINFTDFPGEVEDQTLGGLSTNLANECLNVFAGSQYLTVVDKLQEEKLNLKYFQPMQSNYVIKSLLGSCGIFNYLSNPFTQENFQKLQKKARVKKYFHKSTKFSDDPTREYLLNVKFSHMNITYNYESLHLETKSLLVDSRLTGLFAGSKNSIIKSVYKSVLEKNKSFYSFTLNTMKELFKPVEGLSPFVIYCLHSNNSLKLFFGDKYLEHKNNWAVPHSLTKDMLKNSLAIPVLHWEWFGYHEWVSIESFVSEYSEDFEKIKDKFLKFKKINKFKDVAFKDLNNLEIVTYILSVLGNDKTYILGANHVILKKGVLKELRKLIDSMNDTLKNVNSVRGLNNISNSNSLLKGKAGATPITNSIINLHKKNSEARSKSSIQRKNTFTYTGGKEKDISVSGSRKNLSKKPSNKIDVDAPVNNKDTTAIKQSININKALPLRKATMKIQCHLNLIDDIKGQMRKESDVEINESININMSPMSHLSHLSVTNFMQNNNLNENKDPSKNVYNLFNLLNINPNAKLDDSYDHLYSSSSHNLEHELQFDKFNKDNNIIIPKKKYFNVFKSLFDCSKADNFDVFDYDQYLSEIIKIQTGFRSYRAIKKYKVYRFLVKKVIQLQKVIRGMITKKKFSKFIYCHNCIVFIQKMYRMRQERKNNAVLLIQTNWRSKKAFNKMINKLQRMGNENYDEEEEEDYHLQISFETRNKKDLETELLNVSIKKDRKRSLQEQRPYGGQMSLSELQYETDKGKIINHLLMESAMSKNMDPNLQIGLNEKMGISKRLKKSINQQKEKKIKEISKKGNRIEDKLIKKGENTKLKIQERKLVKLQDEETKFCFKPEFISSSLENKKFQGVSFMQRIESYKNKKEHNLEQIRNNCKDPDELKECTFKPQLTQLAQGVKRNTDDLYFWKQKKDENLIRKQQEKDHKELETIERNINQPKMTRNSELIVRYKLEKTLRETMNQPKDDFDLWPANMEKNYFEK